MSNLDHLPAADAGKDYILQVRVKNGPLLRAMRAEGYSTVAELARACGMPPQSIYDYLSLRAPPISDRGWRDSALKIATHLRRLPEDLFPPQHLLKGLTKVSTEIEASLEDIVTLYDAFASHDPQEAVEQKQRDAILYKIIDEHLTPRYKTVLFKRCGLAGEREHTLDEVATEVGLSRERIRQMEYKAKRKISKPLALAMRMH